MEPNNLGYYMKTKSKIIREEILSVISQSPKPLRWSEIYFLINEKRKVENKGKIGRATLTNYLKELEKEGIIERKINGSIYPPAVYYFIPKTKRKFLEKVRLLEQLPLMSEDKLILLKFLKENKWEEAVRYAKFLIEKLESLVEMEEAEKKAEKKAQIQVLNRVFKIEKYDPEPHQPYEYKIEVVPNLKTSKNRSKRGGG